MGVFVLSDQQLFGFANDIYLMYFDVMNMKPLLRQLKIYQNRPVRTKKRQKNFKYLTKRVLVRQVKLDLDVKFNKSVAKSIQKIIILKHEVTL